MKNKRIKIILATVAIILLIPFIAMQFTDEVSWGILDFVVMSILLLTTGFLIELVIRKVTKIKYRIALGILIIIGFLITWVELAVGIFGTPFAGN
ncbi:MAG: hypothetical protein GXO79_11020 [Chlorobi bacterium]|nr:hypothetical protein [Chlorobiota bacterium]